MAITTTPSRSAPVAPLILRLAVAAILAGAGWSKIQSPPNSGDTPAVPSAAAPTSTADTPINETALVQDRTPTAPTVAAPRTAVSEKGVALNLNWQDVLGFGQLGFAAALLFGLFTRLAALIGLGGVSASALGMGGEHLAGLYAANPTAMLLLGAICLTLLIAGSGPVAVDRTLAKRRQRRVDGDPVGAA